MNTKGFSTLVQGMAAAVQAGAAGLVDFTIGSVLRAVIEAVAQVTLWLQGLILTLLATTRAATSSGGDLDSFMADFDVYRNAAIAAAGQITLSRITATAQGFVQVGALVATTDGSQQFAVTADTGNPAYSSLQGGYVLPAGVASVTVPAAASVAGSAGNVAPASITTIVSEIPGIDAVTNAAPFTAGQDAELDPALRAKFRAYMRSLRTSNDDSIKYAILSVQAGLRYTIVSNQTYPELRDAAGYFFITVDDGTGAPPQSLLDSVFAAVLAVRACGVQFGVFAPNPVTINAALAIAVTPSSDYFAAASAVQVAVTAYVDGLSMQAQTIPLTKLAQLAYGAHPSVTNVPASSITINGAATDFSLTAFQVPEAGVVTVTSA